ncbi:MAG: flagellar biosynthesis protein FlhB [Oscillospiraceae bacterium]|nr:flagellar biosynthesis protein FlhB [Oscillospiraceae bacterium]
MTGGGGEKTERASAHKKSEQRKKGNVFQSRDLISGVMILLSFLALRLLAGYLMGRFSAVVSDSINLSGSVNNFDIPVASSVMFNLVLNMFLLALPMLLVAMVLGFGLSVAQTRFIFSSEQLKPKFSRLNPVAGIKKMVNLRALVELVKSILKVTVITYIIYTVINSRIKQIPALTNIDIRTAAAWLGQTVFDVALYAGIGMIVIGVADYLYQWWDYEKNLRMTKQEVKEENKTLEGNPEVKGRIRSIQRKMAQQRMMSEVKNADVVIRNPQHYAVALKYKPEENDRAPVVIAKGKDYMALQIVKEAQKYEIYTVENPPLARALFASVEIDQEIPKKFWHALADIILHLYEMNKINLNKLKAGSQTVNPPVKDMDIMDVSGMDDMFNPEDYEDKND